MKNDRPLTYLTIGTVTLLHAGILALAWNVSKPPEPVAVDNLTFVDLGSLQGDDKPLADGAPAPMETATTPRTPPKKAEEKPQLQKPKPVKTVAPKIKAVERDDKPVDIAKSEPKQPKQEKSIEKPIEKPLEPVNKPKPSTEIAKATPPAATNPQTRVPNDVVSSGQGTNPNSKAPGNPASDNKDGDGKGKKGTGDKPNSNSGVDPNQIIDGGYISPPNVSYPARARENEEEGVVQIEFIVEPNGSISSPKVVKSSGSRTLDNAALAGVRTGRFKAKSVNGVPVRSRFRTKFEFSLS
ncbi:energy transducer TonB [Neisseriaceae bacterium B1]